MKKITLVTNLNWVFISYRNITPFFRNTSLLHPPPAFHVTHISAFALFWQTMSSFDHLFCEGKPTFQEHFKLLGKVFV